MIGSEGGFAKMCCGKSWNVFQADMGFKTEIMHNSRKCSWAGLKR